MTDNAMISLNYRDFTNGILAAMLRAADGAQAVRNNQNDYGDPAVDEARYNAHCEAMYKALWMVVSVGGYED